MTGYLLDTHIWYWFLTDSERLPSGLRRDLSQPGVDAWLSPISIWEVGILESRGRISIEGGFREWCQQATERVSLREAPLTREVAMLTREVDLALKDPADRFLAATALVYGLTLLTVDKQLTWARWLPTRSS